MSETKGFDNSETNKQNESASDGVRGKFDFNGFTTFKGTNDNTQVKSEVLGNTIRKAMTGEAGDRGTEKTGDNILAHNNPFKAGLGGIPLD